MKLERRCRQLKEQQKLYQTTFLPIKCLSDVAQVQLQRAKTEGDSLKQLLPTLQMAVAQTTSEISAVQTSLQKLSVLITQDKDWVTSADHSARDSMISEGSMYGFEGCTSEVNRQQNHSDNQTSSNATTDLQQSQSISGHQLEMTPATTYQQEKRRTKSESAGTGTQVLGLRHVASDAATKPAQVDIKDSQLQSILKQRKKHVEATSNSQ